MIDKKVQASTSEAKTILIVDDEIPFLNVVSRMVADSGYTVIAAHSPQEALRQAENADKPIHLVITDLFMPEVSGIYLAQQLKTILPHARLLYMSGHPADILNDDLHCSDRPAHFLQKPFRQRELAAKINEILVGCGTDTT